MVFQTIALSEARRLGFWDALIVSAAVAARCDVLYTEDLDHGQLIEGVRVENPFRDAVI